MGLGATERSWAPSGDDLKGTVELVAVQRDELIVERLGKSNIDRVAAPGPEVRDKFGGTNSEGQGYRKHPDIRPSGGGSDRRSD